MWTNESVRLKKQSEGEELMLMRTGLIKATPVEDRSLEREGTTDIKSQ